MLQDRKMPLLPQKRAGGSLSRKSASSRRKDESRAAATGDEEEIQRKKQRTRMSDLRSQETDDDHSQRVSQVQISTSVRRSRESNEARAGRQALDRASTADQRSQESNEARSQRQAHVRTGMADQRSRVKKRGYHEKKLGVVDSVDFEEEAFDCVGHSNLFNSENVCTLCGSYRWKGERLGFCCEKGKIKLPLMPDPPQPILQLYSQKDFLTSIRKYNNALSLASLGVGQEIIMPNHSPTVKIQGKVYHRIGVLIPQEGDPPKFAQIYFTDTDNEAGNRLLHNSELSIEILTKLQECLHRVNSYVKSLKMAIELQDQSPDIQLVIDAEKRPSGKQLH